MVSILEGWDLSVIMNTLICFCDETIIHKCIACLYLIFNMIFSAVHVLIQYFRIWKPRHNNNIHIFNANVVQRCRSTRSNPRHSPQIFNAGREMNKKTVEILCLHTFDFCIKAKFNKLLKERTKGLEFQSWFYVRKGRWGAWTISQHDRYNGRTKMRKHCTLRLDSAVVILSVNITLLI